MIKKAKCQRIDAFELWYWRRLLRVPWTARRSNQSILKEVNPKGSQPWISIGRTDAEAPVLWPPDVKSQLFGKDSDAGKDCGQEEKEAIEDEMVGWHHQLTGYEFDKTLEDSEGEGSLACCSAWSRKNSNNSLHQVPCKSRPTPSNASSDLLSSRCCVQPILTSVHFPGTGPL